MKKQYMTKRLLRRMKTQKIDLRVLFSFFCLLSLASHSQQTYTFTNCNATGSVGPTQSQITLAYTATNLSLTASTSAASGIQTFTAPTSGNYLIDVRGASGGTTTLPNGNAGGLGSRMQGVFFLNIGDVLRILVGQQGETRGAGTGGGGTYVTINNVVAIVAGGGGGGTNDQLGANSVTVTSGTNDNPGGTTLGGTGGNGGQACNTGVNNAGGGGGYLTNGGTGTGALSGFGNGGGGLAFVNGGTGGMNNIVAGFGQGGFGGGGGSTSNNYVGGGGGGGYSGGAGGQQTGNCNTGSINRSGGGGGGSYNSGTSQVNTPGINYGHGKVILSELCNINLVGNGATGNVAICSGNSLTLTTSAVSNYTWSNGNTTSTMIVVSPTSSQTFSVIGTSTAACQSAASISVTVNSGLPVITITNTPNTMCLGKTATLTAGGALSYTWAGGPGGIINGQTFTPTATSNYTVTGQNGCGTTTSVTTITIAPLVVNAAATSTLVCSGNTTTLTASSAVSGYTWYPMAVPGISVVVVPTVNTIYTVSASDGTCAGVATVAIATKPNPTLSIVVSSPTVCAGAVISMTASGALTYTWTSPSSNAPNISDTPTTATLYQVSGTNSVNCVASVSQLVLPQPSPTIAISASKTFVCSGDPVTLTASGATSYNWTNGPPTAGNAVNPTSNTTYTVTGTTAPCSSSLTVNINVLTASIVASVATPSICKGASAVLNASGASSYVWVGLTAFNGNVTVTPTVTTIYTVNATTTSAGLSCPSSTNITITVFNNPTVTIATTKTLVCKTDAPIVLTAGGATTYTWSTGTVSANISVHPQSTTTYSIIGVDANGCVNTTLKVIQVNTCNGIAELTDKGNTISIYPNPNNGEFTIQANSEMTLTLVNELGQIVNNIALTESNNYKVSISDLAKGVYFITGLKDNSPINQKVIVTK